MVGTALVRLCGVSSIGEKAFYECLALELVEFAENSSLTTIGEYAFAYSGIASMVIPNNVSSIDEFAFAYCYSLERVEFEENCSLSNIEYASFMYSAIKEITIPASIVYINSFAFENCVNLKVVNFEENSNLNGIYNCAFSYCGIIMIAIPENVEFINHRAFYGCEFLVSVYLQRTIANDFGYETEIEDTAFEVCPNLTRIIAADEQTAAVYIQDYPAIAGLITYVTQNLTYNLLDDGTYSVSQGNANITGELIIPYIYNNRPVTSIANYAFSNCVSITEVFIPCSILTIFDNAFSNCVELTYIMIPCSVR